MCEALVYSYRDALRLECMECDYTNRYEDVAFLDNLNDDWNDHVKEHHNDD
jgi:hypothetical protein